MKAVILQTKEDIAAVMTKSGDMYYVKNLGYERGQLIEFESDMSIGYDGGSSRSKVSSFSGWMSTHRRGAAAAAITLVLLSAGGVSAYAAPVSTISMDTVPAIEYKVNIFDRVVDISAADTGEDGTGESEDRTVFIKEKVRGKKVEDAIDITINELGDDLSFDTYDDEAGVVVKSVFVNREEAIKNTADTEIKKHMGGFSEEPPAKNDTSVPGDTAIPSDGGSLTENEINQDVTKPAGEDSKKAETVTDEKTSFGTDEGNTNVTDNAGNNINNGVKENINNDAGGNIINGVKENINNDAGNNINNEVNNNINNGLYDNMPQGDPRDAAGIPEESRPQPLMDEGAGGYEGNKPEAPAVNPPVENPPAAGAPVPPDML